VLVNFILTTGSGYQDLLYLSKKTFLEEGLWVSLLGNVQLKRQAPLLQERFGMVLSLGLLNDQVVHLDFYFSKKFFS
jgi:hypothetical protein